MDRWVVALRFYGFRFFSLACAVRFVSFVGVREIWEMVIEFHAARGVDDKCKKAVMLGN